MFRPHLSHPQLEALLAAALDSTNPNEFALVCLLGLLGLRVFERRAAYPSRMSARSTTAASSASSKRATRRVLVRMPPAVARAVARATADRTTGPLLRNSRGARMDRHAATRRRRRLATETRHPQRPLPRRPPRGARHGSRVPCDRPPSIEMPHPLSTLDVAAGLLRRLVVLAFRPCSRWRPSRGGFPDLRRRRPGLDDVRTFDSSPQHPLPSR